MDSEIKTHRGGGRPYNPALGGTPLADVTLVPARKEYVPEFVATVDDMLVAIAHRLQLTESQFNLANGRYRGVGAWIADEKSRLYPFAPSIFPQGSLAIDTTVKPTRQTEFDLDFVIKLDLDASNNPMVVYELLWERLGESAIYAPLRERKNRCIRLQYAGDFHIDILPAIPDIERGNECVLVPDCEAQGWKHSNPAGYVKWFKGRVVIRRIEKTVLGARTDIAPLEQPQHVLEKGPLKIVVQLVKRWRDIVFEGQQDIAPSIVLTTMLGMYYQGEPTVLEALQQTVSAIANALPVVGPPRVPNPSNPKELLSERWEKDREKYHRFRAAFVAFANELEALHITPLTRASTVLKKIFGEKVVTEVLLDSADHVAGSRDNRHLFMNSVGGGAVGISTTPSSVRVPRGNFYGSR